MVSSYFYTPFFCFQTLNPSGPYNSGICVAPPLGASPWITLVLATFLRPCWTKFRHWSEMALKKRQRAAKWRQTTQRWVEAATATEKSAIVNGYFFWLMSACFIKSAARDKRSPTSLSYGQIVEDKTTKNKKVIPLRSCAHSANHFK